MRQEHLIEPLDVPAFGGRRACASSAPARAAGSGRHGIRGVRLAVIVVLAVLVLSLSAVGALAQQDDDVRPDIVLFYMDDVPRLDGRLWTDPTRTPALAALFNAQGTNFTAAIVETPLCAPSRAGLMTGLHTTNHGVDGNDVSLFDPRVTVAVELRDVGYRTMYVGKYSNGLKRATRSRSMMSFARGWDIFDVQRTDQGRYYDYELWTRDGVLTRGSAPADHFTVEVTRRSVSHLAAAPDDSPVFMIISPIDLHDPSRPKVRYEGDPQCRDIQPWTPPNFNEADVADKPLYIRNRDVLPRESWKLATACEQMRGIDDLVGRVVEVQRGRNRLDDTLFIFTADNGMAWGAHRLGATKGVPYATPVPLLFAWPARWGTTPRTIDEPVSNIDVAPTLCAIAGCTMGPYRDGREESDGADLLALLDGSVAAVNRDVVYEQGADDYWTPDYWGLRTTPALGLGRWHYVVYETGEEELYDSTGDAWELQNQAGNPAYQGIRDALVAQLCRQFPEAQRTLQNRPAQ